MYRVCKICRIHRIHRLHRICRICRKFKIYRVLSILNHLKIKNYHYKIKIIVIENSRNSSLKEKIEKVIKMQKLF